MKIYNEFDLTEFNSYRIKASCKAAYFPENESDVIEFYKINKPYILLGSGHNIILSKTYYDCNFLIFNGNFQTIHINKSKGEIIAESGISMLDLSKSALENNLSGLEIFYDIPSSLGGAVVMNAGASGEEIKDVISKVRFLDLKDMKVKEILNKEADFTYRNSFFQREKNKVILKVWLQLNHSSFDVIKNKMESIKEQRWAKQPKEYPNAGSVFKRPEGKFVGPMIESLGLKGYTIGGAQISEKHAGFIINKGNATGRDILELIDFIKRKVQEEFGVELEVEQRIF